MVNTARVTFFDLTSDADSGEDALSNSPEQGDSVENAADAHTTAQQDQLSSSNTDDCASSDSLGTADKRLRQGHPGQSLTAPQQAKRRRTSANVASAVNEQANARLEQTAEQVAAAQPGAVPALGLASLQLPVLREAAPAPPTAQLRQSHTDFASGEASAEELAGVRSTTKAIIQARLQ